MGMLLDGTAGAFFMVSIPNAPAIIILPVVAISQMSTGYLIGICCLKEPLCWRGCMGIGFAAVSVIALAGQASDTERVAEPNFFESAVQSEFLLVNLCVFLVIAAAYLSNDKALLFMLLAAYCDGLQFLTTRTLSGAVLQGTILTPTMFIVGGLKGLLIIIYLHCQQLALAQNLSRVAAAYPVAAAMMPVLLGTAFFGDHLDLSIELVLAMAAALVGVALLSKRPEESSTAAHALLLSVVAEKT